MFNVLRKLFKKKEMAIVEVGQSQLQSWFDSKAKPFYHSIEAEIRIINGKVKHEIEITKQKIEILERAELHNPDITIREKQFMEGNRRAYILGINTFLNLLKTDAIELEQIAERTEQFKTNLERFSKSTFRPYKILQEFFSNESKDIAMRVKCIEALHQELAGAIGKAKIDNIQAIQALIRKLTNRTNKKAELEKSIKQNQSEVQNLKERNEPIHKEYRILQQSPDFKTLLESMAERKVIIKQLASIHASVRFPFTSIDAALKKYERIAIEDTKLITQYLNDPVIALQGDKERKILSIIQRVKASIEKGSLDFKDKKKEKMLAAIDAITEEQLGNFKSNLEKVQEDLATIERSIANNPSKDDETRTKDKLANLEKKIPVVEHSIASKMEELEKINLDSIKTAISRDILQTLDINMSIRLQPVDRSDGESTEN